jgi:hypothetical protein
MHGPEHVSFVIFDPDKVQTHMVSTEKIFPGQGFIRRILVKKWAGLFASDTDFNVYGDWILGYENVELFSITHCPPHFALNDS